MSTAKNQTAVKKIKLQYPLTMMGKVVYEVEIRRPKVKDMRQAARFGNTAAEQEVGLLSVLMGCIPEDLDEMDAADYGQLQEVFRDMVEPNTQPVESDGTAGTDVQNTTE